MCAARPMPGGGPERLRELAGRCGEGAAERGVVGEERGGRGPRGREGERGRAAAGLEARRSGSVDERGAAHVPLRGAGCREPRRQTTSRRGRRTWRWPWCSGRHLSPAHVARHGAGLDAPSRSSSPWKTVGWVLGGVGLAGLGVGAVLGVIATEDKTRAHCDAEQRVQIRDGQRNQERSAWVGRGVDCRRRLARERGCAGAVRAERKPRAHGGREGGARRDGARG